MVTRIKERRKPKFSSKNMAAILKLSERQYSRIENYVSYPNILQAIKIADTLGVKDLRELWGDSQRFSQSEPVGTS